MLCDDQRKGIDVARLAADLRKAPRYVPIICDAARHNSLPKIPVLARAGIRGWEQTG